MHVPTDSGVCGSSSSGIFSSNNISSSSSSSRSVICSCCTTKHVKRHVTRHTSHVARHTSHVTITRLMPRVTRHSSAVAFNRIRKLQHTTRQTCAISRCRHHTTRRRYVKIPSVQTRSEIIGETINVGLQTIFFGCSPPYTDVHIARDMHTHDEDGAATGGFCGRG
jgi:hypothetical protein